MFISPDETSYRKPLISWMALTVFAAVFSFVYELMSHHVYSPFMVGLCLIPLGGGFLSVLVHRIRRIPLPDVRTQTLHCWSILTFTIGSMLTGVFDIYGTTSAFTKYYWILGMILLIGAVISYGIHYLKKINTPGKRYLNGPVMTRRAGKTEHPAALPEMPAYCSRIREAGRMESWSSIQHGSN